MKVKICGLTRPQDILAVNEARPDYIGFVFAKSRRQITPSAAAALRKDLNPAVKAVGVFVDEVIQNIIDVGDTIDIIQLHGTETDDYINRLKALTSKPIIKAVTCSNNERFSKCYSSTADYILLDSPGGGTGKRFNWQSIGELNRPFFLAGGLTPENAAEAAKIMPFALDVSSGVETNGFKDFEKIKKFMEMIK